MLSGGFTAALRPVITSVLMFVVTGATAAAVLVAPGAGAARATTATAPPAPTARVTAVVDAVLETTVLTLTNVRRAAVGCPPLRFNRDLRTAARRHSARMANHVTLSHRVAGEPALGTRITRAGYTGWSLVAENVAVGFDAARWVLRTWWLSPVHRRNIKNCRLRELGVGVVLQNGQFWWTQNFGRR